MTASEPFDGWETTIQEVSKVLEQLKMKLLCGASSSGNQICLRRMVASYEESLSVLKLWESERQGRSDPPDSSSPVREVNHSEDSSMSSQRRELPDRFDAPVRASSDELLLDRDSQKDDDQNGTRMASECSEGYKTTIRKVSEVLDRLKHLRASSSGNLIFLERVVTSYEEALLILKLWESKRQARLDPPDSSLPVCKVIQCKDSSMSSQKRKLPHKFDAQVRASSEGPLEELFDGDSWKEYDQKRILGFKCPRTEKPTLSDHSSHLQTSRIERQSGDTRVIGNGFFRLQWAAASAEIVEQLKESSEEDSQKPLKLQVGTVLLLEEEEDSSCQKGYQIDEILNGGETPFYIASSVEDPGKALSPYVGDPGKGLFLYVGSHPFQPAEVDMKLRCQVQRQTEVLSVMKQNGVSSKYLPQLIASGRVAHPGHCRKSRLGGNCDHPWCGTPVLVTIPVGTTVAYMVRAGQFGADEAIRCCHDCLSALSASASAGIRHGDIRPENIICVKSGMSRPYYALIGWGNAILEERDRPAINLHFSSTAALHEGKLCPASDAESLVYVLYSSCGGDLPVLDSAEGALQWRETSWSSRLIQKKLGDISAVLKAFADYVDSLCGTPYQVDYEMWLTRLTRHIL